MTKLQDILANLLKSKQDAITVYPARLGDGSGQVIAGAGLVYIRILDTVTIAACTNVPPIHDLHVWVGYDPIQTNVLRVVGQRDITGKQDYAPSISAHATTHEFMGTGSFGGVDVIKVQLQQFMPLAVWPYQGLKVIIYPGIVWLGTQYKLIADTNPYGKPVPKVLDFTQYPAPNSNKEMYYLIGINNTGDIQIISGNQVDLGTITLADIPAVPDDMLYPLAAVRRSIDQDAIVINRESTDIVDLRYPLAHKHKASAINDGILDSERLPLFSVDKRGAVPPPGLISGKVLRDDGTWTAAGMGDMTKVMYDTDNDGVVDAAESVDWNGVQNKPSTYPPSAHTHPLSDVTGHNKSAHDALGIDADTVDGQHASAFAPSSHTHTPSEVGLGNVTNDAQLKRAANDFTAFTEKTTPTDNDLVLSEDSAASYAKKKITLGNIYLWFKSRFDSVYAALNHNHDASYYTKTQLNTSGAGGQVHWDNVTAKPSTYPPSAHQHAASDTTSGVFDPARIPNLDASKITSGTLSTDRYSAYTDLQAEGRIGINSGQLAEGNHIHLLDNLTGYIRSSTAIACRVLRTSLQTIPNNAWTAITFSTAVFDSRPSPHPSHWSSGSPTRLTCRISGTYYICGSLMLDTNTAGGRCVAIRINGSQFLSACFVPPVSGFPTILNTSTIITLAVNDYIELWVFQNSGGDLNAMYDSSNPHSPVLSIARIA